MASKALLNRRTLMGSLAAGAIAAPFPARFASAQTKSINAVSLSANTNRVFDELLAKQGYFEEFGIAPQTVAVADGTKVIAALVSNSADVCMQLGFASVIPAIQAGAKIKVIAGAGIRPELAVYSAKPEVQSVADLAGRSIAVGPLGAHLHMLMVTLMRKRGVDFSKVQFVNVGSAADAFRAAAAGKVDAAPGELAFYGNPEKYGVHALKDGATWLEVPEYLNQVGIATEAAIERQGDAVVRMLAAYRKLYQFLNSPKSQEAWLRAVQKVLNTNSEEEAATQWNHYQKYKQWAEDLIVPEERVRYMQDLNIVLGTQKALLGFDKIVDFGPARRALALTA